MGIFRGLFSSEKKSVASKRNKPSSSRSKISSSAKTIQQLRAEMEAEDKRFNQKWLRTSGITAGIPVAAPLHHMDERLMHPEDRGTRWRRVMQAD